MLPARFHHRPRLNGASPALHGRRPVLGRVVSALRAAGALGSGIVVLLAWLAWGTPLRASDVVGKTDKPRAAKSKSASTTAKAPGKKPAPLPPFLQMPEQKAARAEVEASTLAPALKQKLLAGDPLRLAEIEDLGRAGLNPELVIKCLRTSGGSYDLLTQDIDRLRAAGLADSVLDFLLTTRSRRPVLFYPSLYYSPWLHHDHHFGDLHPSYTHLSGHDHH